MSKSIKVKKVQNLSRQKTRVSAVKKLTEPKAKEAERLPKKS
jgi:hypothetical protein